MEINGLNRRKFISIAAGSCMAIVSNTSPVFGEIFKPLKKNEDPYLLFYKDASGKNRPVTRMGDWGKKRKQILERMQLAMGDLPARKALPAPKVEVLESDERDGYTRHTVRLIVAENEPVSAYLYVPLQKGIPKRLPAMVALHQTEDIGKGSVDGEGTYVNLAYAKELAEKGYVVIAPDYPSFGDIKDYDFEHDRYQSGTMKGIFDNMRCIDLLQSREDVDPVRIGVIGHSLGGHNAMFLGAFDDRLKVVVSSCGWTLFDYYNIGSEGSKRLGGRLGAWAQQRYMPLLRDRFHLEKVPFDFDEVIAAIAPRAFFSNSPVNDSNFDVKGVKAGIASVSKVYDFFKKPENLQVRYPISGHDFPPEVREEAYKFIDKIIGDIPS